MKYNKKAAAFLIYLTIIILATIGCGSVDVVRMTNVRISPYPEDCYLEIFGSEKDIDRPFEVVCILDAKTGTTIFHRHSIDAAIDKLRPKACKCGADALLIISAEKEGALSTFSAGWGRGKVSAKAIRFIKSKND